MIVQVCVMKINADSLADSLALTINYYEQLLLQFIWIRHACQNEQSTNSLSNIFFFFFFLVGWRKWKIKYRYNAILT